MTTKTVHSSTKIHASILRSAKPSEAMRENSIMFGYYKKYIYIFPLKHNQIKDLSVLMAILHFIMFQGGREENIWLTLEIPFLRNPSGAIGGNG